MKLLVTGHHGYIGSAMVPMLLQAGHEVIGLDTFFYEDCTFGSDPPSIPVIRRDIRDISSRDLQGIEAVVHLAALCNDPLGDLNPELTAEINHKASVHLARLAKEAGVRRFLFASSCSMYGVSGGDDLLSEEAPLRPITPYAVSKVRTEEDLSKLADPSFSPVSLRNATAYGVSSRLRVDVVLNNLVGWGYTTGKIQIMSDGSPWRPIVHVADIAAAFIHVLAAPREKVHDQAFNVGAVGENYQVRDLAEIVQQALVHCTVEYAKDGKADPRNYRVDFGKLSRAFPEFRPAYDACKGAEELKQAYRKVGLTYEAFRGRKYNRLVQLRHLLERGELGEDLRWANGTCRA